MFKERSHFQTTNQRLTGNQFHIYLISHEFLLIGKTTTYCRSFTLNSDRVADSKLCVGGAILSKPSPGWLCASSKLDSAHFSCSRCRCGSVGPRCLKCQSYRRVVLSLWLKLPPTVLNQRRWGKKKKSTCLNYLKAGKKKETRKHHSVAVCVCVCE